MSSRKQVKNAITKLNKQLWREQNQLNQHRHYVQRFFERSWLMLPVILVPAFLAGWKSGKMPVHKLKHFGKFMLLTLISHAKRL